MTAGGESGGPVRAAEGDSHGDTHISFSNTEFSFRTDSGGSFFLFVIPRRDAFLRGDASLQISFVLTEAL